MCAWNRFQPIKNIDCNIGYDIIWLDCVHFQILMRFFITSLNKNVMADGCKSNDSIWIWTYCIIWSPQSNWIEHIFIKIVIIAAANWLIRISILMVLMDIDSYFTPLSGHAIDTARFQYNEEFTANRNNEFTLPTTNKAVHDRRGLYIR